MKAFVLFVEKVVMASINLARFFKFKSGDESETAIMALIDGVFEKLFG